MLKNSLTTISMRRDEYQAKLGFGLFILSLTMFFVASLIGYGIVRFASEAPMAPIDAFPLSLGISTLSMFGLSYAMHRAVLSVRRERQSFLRFWLWVATGTAAIFMVFQTYGLHALLDMHSQAINEGSSKQFGLMFFLVFVHALHVIGGIAFLTRVLIRARRGDFDHEKHWAVDICAMYWHFLDVVWIVMLSTFLLTR